MRTATVDLRIQQSTPATDATASSPSTAPFLVDKGGTGKREAGVTTVTGVTSISNAFT